ncbi:hypothetical protein [Clostridium thermobutyricum]|uniref:hypothetical protein n=1 Tax=Clostridium thermobutyricum TaxID=29372 RepID=UPI002942E2CF|nr:hypothetical protein [Clostridium thermobutyricum]
MDINDRKEFIYIGNLNDKKLWFKFTTKDFIIAIALGVSFSMIMFTTLRPQFLAVPIVYSVLSVKILPNNNSICDWLIKSLKYLCFSQQTYKWGRRKENLWD